MNKLRKEDGAVATIVVTLLSFGVVLGLLAISVDVGRLMVERRQLQNAADAAVLSLAQSCLGGVCAEGGQGGATVLQDLVDANARDGEHRIALQCGRNAGALAPCPAGSFAMKDCPPLPTAYATDLTLPYIEVHTETLSGASNGVTNFFSRANGNQDSTTVHACSRAAWGSPGSTGTTFPLVIRACDWEMATANGTKFAPSPPYTPAGSKATNPSTNVPTALLPYVTHLIAHSTGNASTSCVVGLGASQYAPGGFGWLDDPNDDCSAVYAAGVVGGEPGASPSGNCKNLMVNWVGKEVLIPVFTSVTGTGSNTDYTLSGVSAFYFAGWQDLPSAQPNKDYGVYKVPANLGGTSTPVCQVPNSPGPPYKKASCVWGWFTSPIVPVGTLNPSVPGYGPKTSGLLG